MDPLAIIKFLGVSVAAAYSTVASAVAIAFMWPSVRDTLDWSFGGFFGLFGLEGEKTVPTTSDAMTTHTPSEGLLHVASQMGATPVVNAIRDVSEWLHRVDSGLPLQQFATIAVVLSLVSYILHELNEMPPPVIAVSTGWLALGVLAELGLPVWPWILLPTFCYLVLRIVVGIVFSHLGRWVPELFGSIDFGLLWAAGVGLFGVFFALFAGWGH